MIGFQFIWNISGISLASKLKMIYKKREKCRKTKSGQLKNNSNSQFIDLID